MSHRYRNTHLYSQSHTLQKIRRHLHHVWVPLLYPRHCPFCQKTLPYGTILCKNCFNQLPFTGRHTCFRCGKPIRRNESELCFDCKVFPKSFQGGISLFLYNRVTQQAVLDLKYHNKRRNADYFALELYRYHRDTFARLHIDAIVPIPVHKNKKKKRGYNQAALIGNTLAEYLKIPCMEDLILRTVDTMPQKEFTPQARLTNLQKAFCLNPRLRKTIARSGPHTILLIDDIYTTGATMECCTRILHHAGIPCVYVCSICIGVSRD